MTATHDRKYATTGKPMRLQLTNAAGPQSIAGWTDTKIVLSSGRELDVVVVDAALGIIEEVIDPLDPVDMGDWGIEVHTTDTDGKTYVFPETEAMPQLRVHRTYAT